MTLGELITVASRVFVNKLQGMNKTVSEKDLTLSNVREILRGLGETPLYGFIRLYTGYQFINGRKAGDIMNLINEEFSPESNHYLKIRYHVFEGNSRKKSYINLKKGSSNYTSSRDRNMHKKAKIKYY